MNSPFPFEVPPDVLSFFQLVITPTFGAWFLSEFVEHEGWFQRLTSAWKSRAVMILLAALSIGGRWALAGIYGRPLTAQEIYLGLLVAFIGYISSNWYHGKNHNPTEKTSEERERAAREDRWKPAPVGSVKMSGEPAAAG